MTPVAGKNSTPITTAPGTSYVLYRPSRKIGTHTNFSFARTFLAFFTHDKYIGPSAVIRAINLADEKHRWFNIMYRPRQVPKLKKKKIVYFFNEFRFKINDILQQLAIIKYIFCSSNLIHMSQLKSLSSYLKFPIHEIRQGNSTCLISSEFTNTFCSFLIFPPFK